MNEALAVVDVAMEQARAWMRDMEARGIFDMSRPTSHIKVLHEAKELADEPSLEEAADVLIALTAVCVEQGWSPAQLAAAVIAKVDVNWRRTWERQPDGTLQHVAQRLVPLENTE